MSTSEEIAAALLDLSEAEFFSPAPPSFTPRERRLIETDFEGLAIHAPSPIDVRRRQQLPVVLGVGGTTRRTWEVAQEANLVLVANDLNTGVLHVGKAYPPPEKERLIEPVSRRKPEPLEKPPYARTAGIELLKARDRLDLPWNPSRLALTVISYDRVSNTREVELAGDGPPEEGRLPVVKPAPAPQAKGAEPILPTYERVRSTPKPPPGGVEFVIRSESAPTDSLGIYGAFEIRARKWHLDRTGSVHTGARGKPILCVAVVPVTLLVFVLDGEVPVRMDWAVPVYGLKPVPEGSLLSGFFAIGMKRNGTLRPSPEPQMAYLVLDSRVHGPRELRL